MNIEMDAVRLEKAKKKINDLKIEKATLQNENKRLTEDLEDKTKQIKEKFGLEVNQFEETLPIVGKEITQLRMSIEKALEEIG